MATNPNTSETVMYVKDSVVRQTVYEDISPELIVESMARTESAARVIGKGARSPRMSTKFRRRLANTR